MTGHVPSMFENCTRSPLIRRTLHPFSEILTPEPTHFPQLFKIFLISQNLREGIFRVWAFPSPFLAQRIKFLLCFTEHSPVLLAGETQGRRTWIWGLWPSGVDNSNTKCKLYYCISIKFKNRQNLRVEFEVRTAVSSGGVVAVGGEYSGALGSWKCFIPSSGGWLHRYVHSQKINWAVDVSYM